MRRSCFNDGGNRSSEGCTVYPFARTFKPFLVDLQEVLMPGNLYQSLTRRLPWKIMRPMYSNLWEDWISGANVKLPWNIPCRKLKFYFVETQSNTYVLRRAIGIKWLGQAERTNFNCGDIQTFIVRTNVAVPKTSAFNLHLILLLEFLRPELNNPDEGQPGGQLVRGEDVLPVEQELVPHRGRQRLDQVVLTDGMILKKTRRESAVLLTFSKPLIVLAQ